MSRFQLEPVPMAMRMRRVALRGALIALSYWALAMPQRLAAQDAAQSSGAEAAGPTSPATDALTDEAQALTQAEVAYHEAFVALARGRSELALELLRAAAELAPRAPLSERARSLIEAIETNTRQRLGKQAERAAEQPPAASWQDRRRKEQHGTAAARAELVFFQSLHGIALGAEMCALAQCSAAQPWVLSLMLGAGLGFGLSFPLSAHTEITPGLARALTDGVLWGAANGLGLLIALDATRGVRHEGVIVGSFLAIGQLTGVGLASLLYSRLEPSAGQVSLAASGTLWSLTISSQFLAMLQPKFDQQVWAGLLLATGNLGAVAGALFASEIPMSASRVLLIDLGGVLGTLAGLGTAVLVQGDNPNPTPTFGFGLLGTLVGLALGYHLTSGWDRSDAGLAERTYVAVQPLPGGLLAQLGARF